LIRMRKWVVYVAVVFWNTNDVTSTSGSPIANSLNGLLFSIKCHMPHALRF
jgi:hypothetical protein